MADQLIIDNYPQLALLAWNRVVRQIDEEEAFALYEANWRFIEKDSLIPIEATLVNRLVQRYGHGVWNV